MDTIPTAAATAAPAAADSTTTMTENTANNDPQTTPMSNDAAEMAAAATTTTLPPPLAPQAVKGHGLSVGSTAVVADTTAAKAKSKRSPSSSPRKRNPTTTKAPATTSAPPSNVPASVPSSSAVPVVNDPNATTEATIVATPTTNSKKRKLPSNTNSEGGGETTAAAVAADSTTTTTRTAMESAKKPRASTSKSPTKKAKTAAAAAVAATAAAATTTTTTASTKKRKPATSKKRVTAGTSKTKSAATTTAQRQQQSGDAAITAPSAVGSSSSSAIPTAATTNTNKNEIPPQRVLILDNGGDTVKYGWQTTRNNDTTISRIPNVTARLQQQWTVLVGDELQTKVSNPAQLVGVTRSTERGILTNLGNQIHVWKRILDKLHIGPIPTHTDTAIAMGWNLVLSKTKKTKAIPAKKKSSAGKGKKGTAIPTHEAEDTGDDDGQRQRPDMMMIAPSACAVLIGVAAYCPRTILDQIATIWLDDFGFTRIGFCISSAVPSILPAIRHADYDTACVVDIGYSATTICPCFSGRVITTNSSSRSASTTCIKRLPLGGRHLVNIWKYYTSYRQYNLMDQEYILKDVFEKTAFVSNDFVRDLYLSKTLPGSRRPYDREYVLPDYQTTFQGIVRLPPALQRQKEEREEQEENQKENDDNDEDDEEDEDVDEEEMRKAEERDNEEDEKEGKDGNADGCGDDDEQDEDDDDDEEEEETAEEMRKRILKQRAEEERRRREMEQEQQVLNISTERFVIPEILLCPQIDANLPKEWVGLSRAIVASIESCPKPLQPALYASITVVGGVSQLPNLQHRLQQEIRTLAPCEYEVRVRVVGASSPSSSSSSDEEYGKIDSQETVAPTSSAAAAAASASPTDQAWLGACQLSLDEPFYKWSLSKQEFHATNRPWKRFHVEQGGYLI